MALKLTLPHSIQNVSLQVGDIAYSCNVTEKNNSDSTYIHRHGYTPQEIGEVSFIGTDYIIILEQTGEPNVGDFLMFSKDKAVNNTSLIGYYAELQLKNNANGPIELFAVSAEVAPSSK